MKQEERKTTVGLLFGGRSAEHAVSVRSVRSVVESIDRERFEPVLIGIDRAGRWSLCDERSLAAVDKEVPERVVEEVVPIRRDGGLAFLGIRNRQAEGPVVNVVFPVLHGTYGEDGTLQGMLEMLDVPYVGCGVLGSAIGMDKDVQKRLLAAAGLPVVPWKMVPRLVWEQNRAAIVQDAWRLGAPLFVKPANLGSSVGITKVGAGKDLAAAVELAFTYDTKVLIEHGVDAREIECAVLGNDQPRASVPGEIVPEADFYSYKAKYDSLSEARLLIPAPIPNHLAENVRALAVQAFHVVQCSGMARVDFLLDRGTDEIYVNELNTIPGFTSISMYPKLWEATGLPYADLITTLINLAVERHRARATLSVV
jgi:D-alanine-D-alanine ligase